MVLVQTPQVSWHSGTEDGKNAPLFSLSLLTLSTFSILATAGNDSTVHIWRVNPSLEMSAITSSDIARGLATNGGSACGPSPVHHLLSLSKHEGCVNSIRFSPDGLSLLTAGDRGAVVVWSVPMGKRGGGNGRYWWGEVKTEADLQCKVVRTQCEDIFTASWSPCSRRFMLGSLDHKTTLFSDTSPYSPTYGSSGDWKPLQTLSDHRHYVQGASFDPLGTYAATQGSDRTVVVMQRRPPKAVKPKKESKKVALSESTKDNAAATFTSSSSPPPPPSRQDNPSNDAENVSSGNTAEESKSQDLPPPEAKYELLKSKVLKMRTFSTPPPTSDDAPVAAKPARHNMYVDETMKSFFRRLSWTPDGAFLITPAGIYQESESSPPQFCTYVYARHHWDKPAAILLDGEVPSVAVVPNPALFEPSPSGPEEGTMANLMPEGDKDKHRCVFAVLTRSTVYVYDTHHKKPLFVSKGLHYAGLTDGTWSDDGQSLLVSSSDGYVTLINFEEGELGTQKKVEGEKVPSGAGKAFVPPSTAPPIIPPLSKSESAVEGRPEKRAKLTFVDPKPATESQGKGAKRRIAPTVVSGSDSQPRAETPIDAPVETLSLKQGEGENANPKADVKKAEGGVNVLMGVKKKKKRITPEAVE